MVKKDRILPIAPVDRIIRKADVDRVSESAAETLAEILEKIGIEISKIALEMVKHRKHKIINGEDIKLAWKIFKEK
ncbi:MAG: histone family protein [Candidatus Helarchaeota archaeon]